MLAEFLKNLNWVDILIVTVIGRIVYIGFKNGFIVEFFKCLGVVSAIFFAFHYFSSIAGLIEGFTPLKEPLTSNISFVFLVLLVLLCFKLIRDAFMLITKIQTHPVLDRWVGFFLALVRSFLMASVILIGINMLVTKEEKENLQRSFSYHSFFNIAPAVYQGMFEIIHKAFPSEQMNFKALDHKTGDRIVYPDAI